jgi:two-component sensor histidine kinase
MKNIVDLETASGLGWQLIKLLAKQLDAEITIDQSEGFKVCIEINELKYRSRGL